MSPETAIYEYLKTAAATAALGSALAGVEVLPTVYHRADGNVVVRIGNCESSLAPRTDSLVELDAVVPIEIIAPVKDQSDAAEYVAARERSRAVQLAVANLIFADGSLGGRVCDSILLDGVRAWGSVQATKNAVALLPLVVNPTGKMNG